MCPFEIMNRDLHLKRPDAIYRSAQLKRQVMRKKKIKSHQIGYKSSIWKTEVKGNTNDPLIKKAVMNDLIQKWVIRIVLLVAIVYGIICHGWP